MFRHVLSVMLLVFLLILPVVTAGQEVPAGKWWYNTKIQKNLNQLECRHLKPKNHLLNLGRQILLPRQCLKLLFPLHIHIYCLNN